MSERSAAPEPAPRIRGAGLVREPLIHFLVLGAAIFALARWSGGAERPKGEIVVTRGRVEALAAGFARTWQRPPTEPELVGLVRESVREEAAAREAVALGLDRDDTVVRRRLRQKLEFVVEDPAAVPEPTDAELEAFLTANSDRFRSEDRFTFRQLALSSERGAKLPADAGRLLAELRAAGPKAPLDGRGDSALLESELDDVAASEVASRFGPAFAERLAALPAGEWQGPVESGFGAHLVLVVERVPGAVPTLDQARERVRSEWVEALRTEAREAYYRDLLSRYKVIVEDPDPSGAELRIAGR